MSDDTPASVDEDSDIDIGDAIITRHEDGRRTVECASTIIRVAAELLTQLTPDSDIIAPDGELILDSAGEYRYRFLGHQDPHTLLYKRVDSV